MSGTQSTRARIAWERALTACAGRQENRGGPEKKKRSRAVRLVLPLESTLRLPVQYDGVVPLVVRRHAATPRPCALGVASRRAEVSCVARAPRPRSMRVVPTA